MRDQHEIRIIDWSHWHKVPQQRVWLVRNQRLVHRLRVRHHEQGVAIRRGFRGCIGANHSAATGTVVHDERLSERLRQTLRNCPRVNVRWATRGEGDDDANRLDWIVLRAQRGAH